jgi:glyoxylase-like metal-dependent hydrolase (beta-lactamase superfamily II)
MAELIERVLAPNPGLFTLKGTNTWIVGGGPFLVIDPGPADDGHLDEVRRRADPVAAILLTHRHRDHAEGAARLAESTRAMVKAFSPQAGESRIVDGETVEAGRVRLTAIHTPGHAPDHVVFHDEASGALFTGDAVLGRGTSVIDPPEGDLAQYLHSLHIMVELAPRALYPGHGEVVRDAIGKLHEYLEHRRMRERQVLDCLAAGPATAGDLVPAIYGDYPRELYPVAARSVLAHLLKLERDGVVTRVHAAGEPRFALARVDPHLGLPRSP